MSQDIVLYNCTSLLLGGETISAMNRTELLNLLEATLNADPTARSRQFMTECLGLTSPYVLLWWQKLLWSTLFGIMIAVATTGNAIVMWIVLVCMAPEPKRAGDWIELC